MNPIYSIYDQQIITILKEPKDLEKSKSKVIASSLEQNADLPIDILNPLVGKIAVAHIQEYTKAYAIGQEALNIVLKYSKEAHNLSQWPFFVEVPHQPYMSTIKLDECSLSSHKFSELASKAQQAMPSRKYFIAMIEEGSDENSDAQSLAQPIYDGFELQRWIDLNSTKSPYNAHCLIKRIHYFVIQQNELIFRPYLKVLPTQTQMIKLEIVANQESSEKTQQAQITLAEQLMTAILQSHNDSKIYEKLKDDFLHIICLGLHDQPDNQELLNQLDRYVAHAYVNKNEILEVISQMFENNYRVQCNLGMHIRDNHALAEKFFAKAIAIKPLSIQTFHLGIAQYNLGKYKSAREALKIAHQINPFSLDICLALARTSYMLWIQERCSTNDLEYLLEKLLMFSLPNVEYQETLACVYSACNQQEQAEIHARNAIADNENTTSHAYIALGLSYIRKSEYTHALSLLERGIRQGACSVYSRCLLAQTHIQQKNFAAAEHQFNFIDSKYGSPDLIILNAVKGHFYLKKGDLIEARKLFEKALALNPANQLPLRVSLGKILYQQGDMAAAKAHLTAVFYGYSMEANFYLGEIAKNEKNYQEALRYYDAALSLGTSAELLFSVGHLYELIGDTKSAKPYYTRAYDMNLKDARINLHLGKIHKTDNSWMLARYHLEIAASCENDAAKTCLDELLVKEPVFQSVEAAANVILNKIKKRGIEAERGITVYDQFSNVRSTKGVIRFVNQSKEGFFQNFELDHRDDLLVLSIKFIPGFLECVQSIETEANVKENEATLQFASAYRYLKQSGMLRKVFFQSVDPKTKKLAFKPVSENFYITADLQEIRAFLKIMLDYQHFNPLDEAGLRVLFDHNIYPMNWR